MNPSSSELQAKEVSEIFVECNLRLRLFAHITTSDAQFTHYLFFILLPHCSIARNPWYGI